MNKIEQKSFLDKYTIPEKVSFAILLILIFIVYIIRSKFLEIPFERDEGSFSYFGKMILEGKTPYKDFYEHQFPGLFYFYAVIEFIFGFSSSELHYGFIFVNIISLIALFFASKLLFNSFAACISAATFAFTSLTPNISGFTIQGEHVVVFYISLGLLFYALTKDNPKWYFYLLMGMAMGFAFTVKLSGVFLALWGGFVLLIEFAFNKERSFKSLFNSFGFYAIGGFSVILFFLLVVYLHGTFSEMVFWLYDNPKHYLSRVTLEEGLKYFGYTKDAIFQFNKFLWIHALFVFVILFIKSIEWKNKIIILSLGVFSFFTIVPGYYFYGHYWIQLTPALAILAGAVCYACLNFTAKKFNLNESYIGFAYLILFSFLLFSHVKKFKPYYFKPNYEMIMRNTYGNNPFPEIKELAKQMNTFLKLSDQVALIGSEPEFYIYTNKKSPSKHLFFTVLVADMPEHKQWQRDYAKSIEEMKPNYLVYVNHPISLLVQPNTDRYIFDWANKYITENYKLIGLIDMVDGYQSIYKWNQDALNYKPLSQMVIYVFERKA
jgi:hypothetical protein